MVLRSLKTSQICYPSPSPRCPLLPPPMLAEHTQELLASARHLLQALEEKEIQSFVSQFVSSQSQKKRDVHKISARNSGAGNGCANFMGAWHFLVLSAGRTPMTIKFLLLGGVLGFLRRGGGSANFIFMGVGIFPTKSFTSSVDPGLEPEGWNGIKQLPGNRDLLEASGRPTFFSRSVPTSYRLSGAFESLSGPLRLGVIIQGSLLGTEKATLGHSRSLYAT